MALFELDKLSYVLTVHLYWVAMIAILFQLDGGTEAGAIMPHPP